MEEEIAILQAKINILISEKENLEGLIYKKNMEIRDLKRKIKKLELQIPKKVSEYQLSLSDFSDEKVE